MSLVHKSLPFLLAVTMLASSCASNPADDGQPSASPVGITVIAGWKAGPLVSSRSMNFLPGKPGRAPKFRKVRCESEQIELRIAVGIEIDAHRLCEASTEAVMFISMIYPETLPRWRIDLVPNGLQYETRRRWIGLGVPRLGIAAPSFEDTERTIRNLIDLVAHESYHVAAFFSGTAAASNELMAYHAGLCAQLAVYGAIHLDSLPHVSIEHTNDLTINSSLGAAHAIRQEFLDLLADGSIVASTDAGLAILTRCKEKLLP